MPRKSTQKRKAEGEHTHIAIRVQTYDAQVGAAVNHNAYSPQHAFGDIDNDPLYKFTSQLRITGVSIDPQERAGDIYELTVYGDDSTFRRLDTKLKDVHAVDARGVRQYRKYRGKEIPVYVPPSGMGLIDKIRGEKRWTAWIPVLPRVASDALMLLTQHKDLFIVIHERKEERTRWVQGVTFHTADPQEE